MYNETFKIKVLKFKLKYYINCEYNNLATILNVNQLLDTN